jgi:hypothetical protein
MWHAWERREKCTRFWRGSPKESDLSEDIGRDGRLGSELILRRLAVRLLRGFNWLSIGAVVNAVMNLPVLAPRS